MAWTMPPHRESGCLPETSRPVLRKMKESNPQVSPWPGFQDQFAATAPSSSFSHLGSISAIDLSRIALM